MVKFLLLFLGVVVLAYILERFLLNILGFYIFRVLVIPGIIVHELSHAAVALAFGSHIKRLEFFKKEGGEVAYSKPKLFHFSQPLISIFPVIGATLILYFISLNLGFSWESLISNQFSFENLSQVLKDFAQNNWQFYLFIYLILSLTAAMGPSKKDLMTAAVGLIILGAGIGLIAYFFPSTAVFWDKLSLIYLISLYLIIFALVLGLILWLLKFLIFSIFKL